MHALFLIINLLVIGFDCDELAKLAIRLDIPKKFYFLVVIVIIRDV